VFVRADGALAYEKVLQLLAIAKNAGIPKVGLVTQPGPPPAPQKGSGAR
jgi:biopolymer transport protein ExbD